ncbi:6-phosphogluconolactonase [Enterococcus sp. JM4C]|uniref:glucosamine-6-phosphate deaminase n=1 Tax=Candidatus Enterococcus huntleyi TaxID=1857217 RepID=UPI00137B412F|nr:glucosamine-6-phosphate deaminase [Enterococcus sp. JM4C]KAF1299110.1 6-phosphogluconolactonase [Enterococcus sp. JM4C]
MKLIIVKDYEEMSQVGAEILLGEMHGQHRKNISITAGASPQGIYERMIPRVKDKPYFEHVHYYNFDEIDFKGEDRVGVTMGNLKKMYFDPANIKEENIHALDSDNYQTQDERIKADGGLDFILLGVGADGHFCGNLPGTTKFGDLTSRVNEDATPTMKEVLLNEVGGVEALRPEFYVTMGPKSIMQVKKLLMVASGEKKAAIVKALVDGVVTEDLPSTLLTTHPDFTLVVDEAAASLL